MAYRTTTTTEIPTDLVDEVAALMAQFTIGQSGTESEPESSGEPAVNVTKVIGHRFMGNNGIQFRLRFEDGTESWVPDVDCDCERLIKEYIEDVEADINTIYVYCRVSSKGQSGENHVSLGVQRQALMVAAMKLKREGSDGRVYHRIKVLREVGSAYRGVPKLFRLISDYSVNGDAVIVYRADRLSRNVVRYLQLLEDMADNDVEIISLESGSGHKLVYNNQADKLEFIQKILDANREAAMIGRRVKEALKITRPVYGHMVVDDENGERMSVQNPEEQEVLSFIRHSDASPAQIAQHLNQEGLTKRGKEWNAGMVKYAIKNYL